MKHDYMIGWSEKRLACGHLELVPPSGELANPPACGECDAEIGIALSIERYDSRPVRAA